MMAIGRDMRLSSPELAEAAVRGAADAGANVVDIGQVGTEMLYFAVGEYGYQGGLQVTASHNPAAYNGMKIVRRGALPVGGDSGLDRIKALAIGSMPARSRAPRAGLDSATSTTVSRARAGVHRPIGACARCGSSWTPPTGWRGRWSARCWNGCRSQAVDPRLRARRLVSQPRAEPAPGGEPASSSWTQVRSRVPTWDRLGRGRRPLLLHRRPGRVRPRRPDHRADRPLMLERHPGSDHRLRPAGVVGGA